MTLKTHTRRPISWRIRVLLLLTVAVITVILSRADISAAQRMIDRAGGGHVAVDDGRAPQAVSFHVRPVVVLVVDDAGRPTELWTNLAGAFGPEQPMLRVRRGSVRGNEVRLTPAFQQEMAAALAAADWNADGLVWRA
jgi:hypothetical protein